MSGEFTVVNQHLLVDLSELGLWNDSMKNLLIANDGSIQDIPQIPEDLKPLYKTVWEIKQVSDEKDFVEHAYTHLYLFIRLFRV